MQFETAYLPAQFNLSPGRSPPDLFQDSTNFNINPLSSSKQSPRTSQKGSAQKSNFNVQDYQFTLGSYNKDDDYGNQVRS